ncbi:MAG: hypothetical protein LBG58_03805, partial [Planctomycetaceae bacterium]|nr:hypothetical protein [Planctomycetaceae bacterium]
TDQCYSLRTPEYYYELWFPNKENSGVTRQTSSERKPSYKDKPFDIQMLGNFLARIIHHCTHISG